MTDDQLRAMARRVLGLVTEVVHDERLCYVGYADGISFTQPADEIEAAAVAILREEMGKAEQHPLNDVLDSYEMTDEEAEALLALPATQTIVIDT